MTISLRQTASVLALSLALMMGGCGKKDKGTGPQMSVEAAPLGLTKPAEKVFARHFEVPARKVDKAEAEKALALLGLAESGSNGLSWDSRKGGNGNYVYSNLRSEKDGNVITVKRAELAGAHMVGDSASFDRANFSGLNLKNEDVTIEVEALSLARPTPKAAKKIIQNLQDMSGKVTGVDISDMEDSDELDFGAMSLTDIKVSGEELNGSINQIVYGEDVDTGQIDFKVDDINFKITKDDITSVVSLGGLSGLGVDSSDMKQGFDAGKGGRDLSGLFANMNVYKKPYDSFLLDDLTFDNPYVNVEISNFSGQAETRGDVTTITQKGNPMVITLKDIPNEPEAQRVWDILEKLDMKEIKLRASQVTVLDKGKDTVRLKDGLFEMEDGFKLNYTYGASGLSALKKLEQEGADAATEAEVMETLKLDNLKISLVDESIVDRGMKLAEEMTGQPRGRMLTGMKGMIAMTQMAAQTDVEKELASELGMALIAFAEKGGTLTVEFGPSSPIPMSQFMALQDKKGSLKAMGFSATQSD